MINLTINDKSVKVKKGMTVLKAAESAGIAIPALCSHPELLPYGGCRLCIVEIKGMRGVPTSCTTPAEEGMVVKTDTPKIRDLRKNILKLLLSYHTSPCIVCPHKKACEEYRPNPMKSGKTTRCEACSNRKSCTIRDLSEEYGIDDLGMPVVYKNYGIERQDPFMDRDYNLCIHCGKCVRVCKKLHGVSPIEFTNRGENTRIDTAFHRDYTETECVFCGACIDICPNGTLTDRSAKWSGESDKVEETKCDLCSVGCPVKLKVKDGKIFAAETVAFTDESRLCAMGRFMLPQVFDESDRITAAVQKLAGFSNKRLIQTVIDDLEKKNGGAQKKIDIIIKLKAVLEEEEIEKQPAQKEVVRAETTFKIVYKKELVPNTYTFNIYAPDIAKKCKPGQFVIAIANEKSERIPYTITDWDSEKGTVTINVIESGKSSQEMVLLNEGDCLAHFVGPFGIPVEIKKYGTVVCGGGCFGVGGTFPIARALKEAGNKVIFIEEASSGYLLCWKDKPFTHCDELMITTKDGSVGIKGGVQEAIVMLMERGEKIDQAFIIGCTFMMMSVSEITKKFNIPTQTALNPIMIDGTGMCGACRVSIEGKTKFACVDGPFFDGHQVDWDLLKVRRGAYVREETQLSHMGKCMVQQ